MKIILLAAASMLLVLFLVFILIKYWKRLKWLVKELVKIYSNNDSFFSKKRIESSIAFLVAEWGMIDYFIKITSQPLVDVWAFGTWATIQFGIAGYTVNQIQKEKKDETN